MNQEQTINLDEIRLRHSDYSRAQAADMETLCRAVVLLSNQLKEAQAKIKELEAAKEK